MKPKNSKLYRSIISTGMITVLAVVMLLLSCKRNSVENVSVKNDMIEAAKVLGGTVFSGKITIESNENEISLNYNNGNKFILIEKIKGAAPGIIYSIQSAEVITSKYGVILKDLSNNKIFLLINNDSKSLKMFEQIDPLFDNNLQSERIFGTTLINTEKV